jgi:hypothetical protein
LEDEKYAYDRELFNVTKVSAPKAPPERTFLLRCTVCKREVITNVAAVAGGQARDVCEQGGCGGLLAPEKM